MLATLAEARPRLVKGIDHQRGEPVDTSTWRVSVVIPTLNEAANLPSVLPLIPDWIDEVLIVDGHSTDGTADVARQLRPDVRIVQQDGRGKGDAIRAGFQHARGDIVVMLDADGSMDPGEIPGFVGALLAGADMAKGSRFMQGGGTSDMPLYRQLGNWGFVMLVRLFFGGRYSDLCYGYIAFWAHVLPHFQLDCDGFEVETVLNIRALRAGMRVTEVPSFESARVYGQGRLRTIPDGWRVLKAVIRERIDHFTKRGITLLHREGESASRSERAPGMLSSSKHAGTSSS